MAKREHGPFVLLRRIDGKRHILTRKRGFQRDDGSLAEWEKRVFLNFGVIVKHAAIHNASVVAFDDYVGECEAEREGGQ